MAAPRPMNPASPRLRFPRLRPCRRPRSRVPVPAVLPPVAADSRARAYSGLGHEPAGDPGPAAACCRRNPCCSNRAVHIPEPQSPEPGWGTSPQSPPHQTPPGQGPLPEPSGPGGQGGGMFPSRRGSRWRRWRRYPATCPARVRVVPVAARLTFLARVPAGPEAVARSRARRRVLVVRVAAVLSVADPSVAAWPAAPRGPSVAGPSVADPWWSAVGLRVGRSFGGGHRGGPFGGGGRLAVAAHWAVRGGPIGGGGGPFGGGGAPGGGFGGGGLLRRRPLRRGRRFRWRLRRRWPQWWRSAVGGGGRGFGGGHSGESAVGRPQWRRGRVAGSLPRND